MRGRGEEPILCLSERPWSFDPAGKPKGMSQTTQLYHLSEPLRLPRVPVCCALCDPLYCLNPRCHPILLFKNVGYVIDPRLRVGDDPACLVTTQTTQASRGVFPPKEIPRTPHPAISLSRLFSFFFPKEPKNSCIFEWTRYIKATPLCYHPRTLVIASLPFFQRTRIHGVSSHSCGI